jgi:Mg2+ and Co2+ transporter CorA
MANQQQDPKAIQQLIDLYQQVDKLTRSQAENMANISSEAGNVNKEIFRLKQEANSIQESFSSIAQSLKDSIQEFSKYNSTASNTRKTFSSIQNISSKLLSDQSGFSRLSEKELKNLKVKLNLEAQNLQLNINSNKLTKEQLAEANDVLKRTATLTELLKKRLEKENEITKAIGVTGNALKGLSKIPGIGGMLNTDEAVKEMEDLADSMHDQGKNVNNLSNKLKIAGAGLKVAFKGVKESLTDPVSMITFFVTQALKADKQITELANSLGVSKQQSKELRENFVKYSANVNDTFINTDRLLKSQTELSQQLGISVNFSNQEADAFARITELTGLTAEEAGKIAKFSAASGKEIRAYEGRLLKGAQAAQQATKSHFSTKQILQDVSKLSAGILVKFQGNPDAIGKAVTQAKALGLTLEQVDKVGESLLNFESSIENELKAELITGKQLNLEKARYAALTGDQVTLTRELADQVGSLEDFQNMNVVAQKSLAEAFGMSKDEVADMLLQQEAINKYGDKAKKLNNDQIVQFEKQKKLNKELTLEEFLTQQSEQLAAQDKFNNAITKLQDLIGNLVAGPLGSLIDSLANGLSIITKIFSKFSQIVSAIKGFFGDKVGGVLGDFASVATIGALIALITRSLTKGTMVNPTIVKDISKGGGADGGGDEDGLSSSFGKGTSGKFKRLSKAGGGGFKGGLKAAGRMLQPKSLLKGAGGLITKGLKANALTSLISGGLELGSNLSEGKGVGESLGRTALTTLGSFGGGALGSLLAPGIGTVGGGIAGGMLGDKIGNLIFGENPEMAEGGIITKRTTVTAGEAGSEAIIPLNSSKAASMLGGNIDLSPMIAAINEVRNAVNTLASRPAPQFSLQVDGKAIGTAVGKQIETGTAQSQYTSYKVA